MGDWSSDGARRRRMELSEMNNESRVPKQKRELAIVNRWRGFRHGCTDVLVRFLARRVEVIAR